MNRNGRITNSNQDHSNQAHNNNQDHGRRRTHNDRTALDPDIERDIGIDEAGGGRLAAEDSYYDAERAARETVYPAPLAGLKPLEGVEGVEGLEGHAMDPDGEEESLEDAELKSRVERFGDHPTMELSMSAAKLDGVDGLGLLREVRVADGEVTEVPGSWRPRGDASATPPAPSAGSTMRFEGQLHKADGSVQHVASDVSITSAGDYTTEDGKSLRMINFKVSEPGMLVHAAPDD